MSSPLAAPSSTCLDGLTVSVADRADWNMVQQWAADEGWNPGDGDSRLFQTATEPDGFYIGRLNNRPVSAISVVNYDDVYAHVGHFLVDSLLRGRGIGTATFQTAIAHAGRRAIGLDAVPAQIDRYADAGFQPAWRTIRFEGPLPPARPPGDPHIIDAEFDHYRQIIEMDSSCFHSGRPQLALNFATVTGRIALVHTGRGGRISGYGVLRRAHHGMRIGPLYANAADAANALLDGLIERARRLATHTITIDIPEFNSHALALAEARGLSHLWETTRMYRPGRMEPRPIDKSSIWALSSLELG